MIWVLACAFTVKGRLRAARPAESKEKILKAEYPSIFSAVAGQACGPGTCAIRRRLIAASRAGVLFASVLTFAPTNVQAQCRQWDVSGQWKLQQGDLVVFVNLRQSDKVISGTARYSRIDREAGRGGAFGSATPRTLNGSVAGNVGGSTIMLDMDWDDGSGGIYKGVIGATGMIKGKVIVDKNNPSKTWPWHSMQAMTCADAGAKPKPPVGLGLPPQKSTGPAAPAQPTPRENPVLTAKPLLVIPTAGRDHGYSHLSWDAGAGHPNAELWLKVDNGAWTVAQKQAKDAYRPFKIERGKTYLFSLRDGSGELRTVTVRCQPGAEDTAVPPDASESGGSIEPFIRASREVVPPSPGQDYGLTQLTWDSGDRRARLSVQVDDEQAKMVSSDPKGSNKPFRIERGKTYVFSLGVRGEELGSVTVRGGE